MKELIKEYLKIKIENEKKHKIEMNMLNAVTKQLYEITSKQQLMFDEYSKESYKTKFTNEHKKRKEKEKESIEIIQEFKNSVIELQEKNNKLEKELKKYETKELF